MLKCEDLDTINDALSEIDERLGEIKSLAEIVLNISLDLDHLPSKSEAVRISQVLGSVSKLLLNQAEVRLQLQIDRIWEITKPKEEN